MPLDPNLEPVGVCRPGVLPVGTADGRTVCLDPCAAPGTAIQGMHAPSVLCAILITTLAGDLHDPNHPPGHVVIPAGDAAELLGTATPPGPSACASHQTSPTP